MFENLKKWWKYEPPMYATSDEWDKFDQCFKENAPVRYFLNETVGDWFNKWVSWPIINPIREKWYALKCRILPWRQYNHIRIKTMGSTWHDKDYVMLHAMFQLLTDFVEKEKAWMMSTTEKYSDQKPSKWKKPFWRSRELGLKYLEWESELDQDPASALYGRPGWDANGNPSQSEVARQVIRLYTWWKDDYLNRKNLYEMEIATHEIQDKEHERYLEEQEALEMLVKIRTSLWT